MNANKHKDKIISKDLSYKIMEAVFEVHNTLGCGFLEKVYENALAIKLNKKGLKVDQQAPIKVDFEGTVVGDYRADLLVEGEVIIELKCAEKITSIHKAQTINYLKATGLKLGIILNFAKPKLEFERVVN